MRIAFDARATQTGHAGRGVGRVVRELIDGIARLPLEARFDVVIVGDARPNPALENVSASAPVLGNILSPGRFGSYDVVVRLAPCAPSEIDGRSVVCCYDLMPLKAPQDHFPLHRIVRHPVSWICTAYGFEPLKRASRVWTISRAVAADVHERFAVPWSRLFPILLAASSTLHIPDDNAVGAVRSRLGLPSAFVAWVLGGTNENKNVPGMFRVMAEGGLPPLVIVGGLQERSRAHIFRTAHHVGAPVPRLLGRVDDETLAGVLRGAWAVVVPSLDEGFGLPVVEALACGGSVVANDIPVLREVGGDAESVVYADIGQPALFAQALRSVRPLASTFPRRTWRDVASEVVALAQSW